MSICQYFALIGSKSMYILNVLLTIEKYVGSMFIMISLHCQTGQSSYNLSVERVLNMSNTLFQIERLTSLVRYVQQNESSSSSQTRYAVTTTGGGLSLDFIPDHTSNLVMPSPRHPQEDLLIIEALDEFADQLDQTNANPFRAARGREFARDLAAEHGLDVADALFQIDHHFDSERGPSNDTSRLDGEIR